FHLKYRLIPVQSTSLLLHDIHEKREPFLYLYFLFPTGRYRVFLFEFACFSKHVLFVILVDHAALFLGQSHLQNCPSRLKPLSIDRLLFFYFHLPAFLAFYYSVIKTLHFALFRLPSSISRNDWRIVVHANNLPYASLLNHFSNSPSNDKSYQNSFPSNAPS